MAALKIRSVFVSCTAAAMALAWLLATQQQSYAESFFDFDHFKSYKGEVLLHPYPALRTASGLLPLVAPGKFGADRFLVGMEAASITLRASMIRRKGVGMLELEPGSIRQTQAGGLLAPLGLEALGTFTFSGEIVDSKCYLGVMNPGAGRVHRECAIRCIHGGVPPLFVVQDGNGKSHFLWLTGEGGQRPPGAILDFVAEPVQISGQLFRSFNLLYFQMAPGSLRRE